MPGSQKLSITRDFQPSKFPAFQWALAEVKGRFRRLLKEEDVGWQTPWEVITGHPRHKELP
jgi:hypothetical protein